MEQNEQLPTPDSTPPTRFMATQSPTDSAKLPPVRSFDPFAPLPSSSAQPASFSTYSNSVPSNHSQVSNPSPAPPSAESQQPRQNSSISSSGSSTRAPRPSSLYIPMDDEKRTGNKSGNTPTWPFDADVRLNGAPDHLRPSLSSNSTTPLSPSHIHPSYSEQAQYYQPSSSSPPPLPTTEPQNLYSSISISSSPASEAAFSSSAYPGYSRNGSLHTSKGSILGNRPLTGGGGGGGSSARHSPAYSVGTHALLSSRQNGGSPISNALAQKLDTPAAWLMLYFAFNLGLTLFNKLVLQGFPFPWTLTAIQMLSGTIGTQIALSRGFFTQARLTTKENGVMLAFSGLYTINIAVSNLSLHLVSVPVSVSFRSLLLLHHSY